MLAPFLCLLIGCQACYYLREATASSSAQHRLVIFTYCCPEEEKASSTSYFHMRESIARAKGPQTCCWIQSAFVLGTR
jgi:hypothetical protein